VLVVEIQIPEITTNHAHCFYLQRAKTDEKPEDLNMRIGGGVSCWRACGKGGGYGGNIAIFGRINSNRNVKVSLSTDWRNGVTKGEFQKEIVVPWMEEVTEDIEGGAQVRAYFEKPKP
jgi:hypothetical protein